MHHFRHAWRSVKASMGKFFFSLVDLSQVYIFRHVGRHLKDILSTCFIRIGAQMGQKITQKFKIEFIPLTPTKHPFA